VKCSQISVCLFVLVCDSSQQATNRGFISAAKEYQAGEELTFDYGLLNDAVLAFYGTPLRPPPPSRGVVHLLSQAFLLPTAAASGDDHLIARRQTARSASSAYPCRLNEYNLLA
jgi:hypothetical protein